MGRQLSKTCSNVSRRANKLLKENGVLQKQSERGKSVSRLPPIIYSPRRIWLSGTVVASTLRPKNTNAKLKMELTSESGRPHSISIAVVNISICDLG